MGRQRPLGEQLDDLIECDVLPAKTPVGVWPSPIEASRPAELQMAGQKATPTTGYYVARMQILQAGRPAGWPKQLPSDQNSYNNNNIGRLKQTRN